MRRALALAWAAPYTALGLLAGLAMLAAGGRGQTVRGAVEFSGGVIGRGMARLPPRCRFSAITLGHVILGVDAQALNALREHEQVHVAQYERWGVFFVPAYGLSSAWQLCCGRCVYRDNYFEKQAYAIGGPAPGAAWADSGSQGSGGSPGAGNSGGSTRV
jgi:hypothetical protein